MNDVKTLYTEKAFKKFLEYTDIIQENGKYYMPDTFMARGSNIYYLGNKLKIESITENKVIFSSIEYYSIDYQEYESRHGIEDFEPSEMRTETNKFIIVKENGVWKIDEYTLPN